MLPVSVITLSFLISCIADDIPSNNSTVLFPAKFFEDPPDDYELALSRLCNHPGFMPFFAKGMLVLTEAKDNRSRGSRYFSL